MRHSGIWWVEYQFHSSPGVPIGTTDRQFADSTHQKLRWNLKNALFLLHKIFNSFALTNGTKKSFVFIFCQYLHLRRNRSYNSRPGLINPFVAIQNITGIFLCARLVINSQLSFLINKKLYCVLKIL
jgi:hypothetical protein